MERSVLLKPVDQAAGIAILVKPLQLRARLPRHGHGLRLLSQESITRQSLAQRAWFSVQIGLLVPGLTGERAPTLRSGTVSAP
jgi:hypothetical protein